MQSLSLATKKSGGIIQFIKFGVVGISNTAVDWIVYFVIVHFFVTTISFEPIAKAISFLVAVLNSYLWNTVWTFNKEYKKAGGKNGAGTKIFIKFFVISLLGWGLNYLTFKYTRFNLNQGQIISLVAASAAATLLNFFGNKLWTYKK